MPNPWEQKKKIQNERKPSKNPQFIVQLKKKKKS